MREVDGYLTIEEKSNVMIGVRCYVAGFEDGGRDHEPVNVGSFQKLGEERKHSFLEPLWGK